MRYLTRRTASVAATGFFLFLIPLLALSSTEAINWCEEAERSLTDKSGNPIKCASVSKRCVRMNNYWCQKHGSTSWRGTPDSNGKDGNRDADGHAIFESAVWSARAIAIDLRAKYMRGLISAVDIASTYSPWCDTLGSRAVVQGHGRTCRDGRAKPPADFVGPVCEKPRTKAPKVDDCSKGCNCPPKIANVLTQRINIGTNDDLELFDASGRPLPNLLIVIGNLAKQEQGIYVRRDVIQKGISSIHQQ